MPKIVTSFTGEEIDVSEHEEGVLRDYGVVVDTTATTDAGRRRAVERFTAGQTPDGDDDSQEG